MSTSVTIAKKEDGLWLCFKTASGNSAMLNISAVVTERGGMTSRIMQDAIGEYVAPLAVADAALRDDFAKSALATAAAYPHSDVATWEFYDFARHAYQLADAMLAERAK